MISATDFTAIVLIRKMAFYQWLERANTEAKEIDADNRFDSDYGTYLVVGLFTDEDISDFLDLHYHKLFQNELREWHEPNFWPDELSRELFADFFEVKVNREVYRVGDEDLQKGITTKD